MEGDREGKVAERGGMRVGKVEGCGRGGRGRMNK